MTNTSPSTPPTIIRVTSINPKSGYLVRNYVEGTTINGARNIIATRNRSYDVVEVVVVDSIPARYCLVQYLGS